MQNLRRFVCLSIAVPAVASVILSSACAETSTCTKTNEQYYNPCTLTKTVKAQGKVSNGKRNKLIVSAFGTGYVSSQGVIAELSIGVKKSGDSTATFCSASRYPVLHGGVLGAHSVSVNATCIFDLNDSTAIETYTIETTLTALRGSFRSRFEGGLPNPNTQEPKLYINSAVVRVHDEP